MADPLSEVITLLRPSTVLSKGISGAGRWAVRYSEFGQPSFCVVLEGSCRLSVDRQKPLVLEAGDFVLLPTTPGFTLSGFEPVFKMFPFSTKYGGVDIGTSDNAGEHHVSNNKNQWITSDLTAGLKRLRIKYPT